MNDPTNPSKKIDDYWLPALGMLADPSFLSSLQTFDKDNISPDIITKVCVWGGGDVSKSLYVLSLHNPKRSVYLSKKLCPLLPPPF